MHRKIILIAAAFAIFPALSSGENSVSSFTAAILKGPYIKAITATSATILWETDAPSKSVVEFGTDKRLGKESESNSEAKKLVPDINLASTTVTANINAVTITGLQPDTTYYYRVSSLKKPAGVYQFRTAPEPGGAFRFVVYGDNRGAAAGEQENHKKVAASVESLSPQPMLIINTGDLVFRGKIITKHGSEGIYKDEWQLFFDVIKSLATHTAYYPVFGNHDSDGTSEKTRVFSAFFPKGVNSPENTYYSFDIGNVHFIILNSEIDYSNGSPQYNWLVMDLKNTMAAPHVKFVIASMHRPPYTISESHSSDLGIRNTLSPLFEAYRVDLVFSGHNHLYERSKPITSGVVDAKNGVYYIIAGGGGAPLYGCTEGKTGRDLNEKCIKSLNYVAGDVDCRTTCSITLNVYNSDGAVIDRVDLSERKK